MITAVLSLDATVVLLTPVVFATAAPARGARQAARLRVHAPGQLRLAAAAGVEPDEPAGLHRVSGLRSPVRRADGAALAGGDRRSSTLVLRRLFRTDLAAGAGAATTPGDGRPTPGVRPGRAGADPGRVRRRRRWSASNRSGRALAGAVVLGGPCAGAAPGHASGGPGRRGASPLFCLFVLALGVVVKAVVDHGLGDALRPSAAARRGPARAARRSPAIAAVLANLINNLPAVLALLPLLAAAGPGRCSRR